MDRDNRRAREWDARYSASADGLFGEAPNEYLRMVRARSDFTARSALCLADGDGRNGTWLASRGLQVTAVDHSHEATRRALQRDLKAGVSVERITAGLEDWGPEPGRHWDLVCILYLHGSARLRERTARIGCEAVAPGGGWFLLEGFSKEQANRPGMGPDDPDKLYDLKEILGWLPGMQLVEATSGRVYLEEGRRHAGLAEVDRVTARRRVAAGTGEDPAGDSV